VTDFSIQHSGPIYVGVKSMGERLNGRKRDCCGLQLSDVIKMSWLCDGIHDLGPRIKAGVSHNYNLMQAASQNIKFLYNIT